MLEGYQNKEIKGSPKAKGGRRRASVKRAVEATKAEPKKALRKWSFPTLGRTVEAETLEQALSIINNKK